MRKNILASYNFLLSSYKTIQCILKDCEVNSRLMCNYYVLRQTKESVLVGLNAKCVITLHNGIQHRKALLQ